MPLNQTLSELLRLSRLHAHSGKVSPILSNFVALFNGLIFLMLFGSLL